MRERGFTLLEMLIVLAIVGGLAFAGGNALQKMRGSRLRDSTTEVASSLRWAFDRSLAIGEEMGYPAIMGRAYQQIATMHVRQGKDRDALQQLRLAESAYIAANNRSELVGVYIFMGNCQTRLGDHSAAQASFDRASALSEELKSLPTGSDYHQGVMRLDSATGRWREVLPFEENSNDFVFDSQFLAQSVYFGFKLGDIPVPVRYFPEASSINFRRSVKYGLTTLSVLVQFWAEKMGLTKQKIFQRAKRGSP